MGKRNVFKVASIYIGTVIGAGFASGQEILQFFTGYGIKGAYGIALASILFGCIGAFVLTQVYKYRISTFQEWLTPAFGLFIGRMVELLLTVLLLSWYCVMLAGSGALFEEHLGLGKEIGILFMSGVCFLTFILGMKGLAALNEILIPLLILGIMLIGGAVIYNNDFIISNATGFSFHIRQGNWITSSLLYVSYNSLGAIIVMASLYPLLNNRATALGGGMMGGLGLGLMAVFLFMPTLILYTDIQGVEIPMMAIATRLGPKIRWVYALLLWVAMLTTAVANGFVIIQSLQKRWRINYSLLCFLFCIITIPLAGFGFKSLVNTLYPLFGYMGFFLIMIILFRRLKVYR